MPRDSSGDAQRHARGSAFPETGDTDTNLPGRKTRASRLRNAAAVARAASEAAGENGTITIVCAGRAENPGGFSIDDLYTAGVLVQRLEALGGNALTEWAQAARLLAIAEPDPLAVLWYSAAGRAVIRLGLEGDVVYAAVQDVSEVVPRLGMQLHLTG